MLALLQLLSINAIIYLLRPDIAAVMVAASAISSSQANSRITNCWREAQKQGRLYTVSPTPDVGTSYMNADHFMSSQNFVLTRENIAKIVGGNAEDCEQHIDVVMRASHLHAFAEDVFTVLVGDQLAGEKFKVSFDAPEPHFLEKFTLGTSDDSLSHLINIKPNILDNHLTVFHEGLHDILQQIEQRYFGTSDDPGKIIPNFDRIKKIGDKKFDALFKIVMKKYKAGINALSAEELQQFNKFNQFAEINKEKFPPIINKLVVMTPSFNKQLQVGYSYKISDIMPGELPAKITVVEIKKLNNGHAYVFFTCDSPLSAILTNYRNSQQQSSHGYSKHRETEESIVRIFDLPLEFVQEFYNEVLETLRFYIKKILSEDPPKPLTTARGRDSAYVYGHQRFIILCEKVGLNNINVDQVYTLAHNVIQAQDTEYAHKALVSIARILKDPALETSMKVSMLLCVGELSYLVNDMKQACSAYAKVAQVAPGYFDNNPPFHDGPLHHYKEAAQKTGAKFPEVLTEKLNPKVVGRAKRAFV